MIVCIVKHYETLNHFPWQVVALRFPEATKKASFHSHPPGAPPVALRPTSRVWSLGSCRLHMFHVECHLTSIYIYTYQYYYYHY